jgi:hypothetical protein
MRFMMMVKSDERAESGAMPDEKLLSAMGKYNDELVKAGVLMGGEGLQASSKGVRVRHGGKKTSVVDGPFAEAKELVGGYWIIQVKSKEEAVEWARRVPLKDAQIELRPLWEAEDFPAEPGATAEGPRGPEPSAPQPVRRPGTTRYIALLKADKVTESGALPERKILEDMGVYMADLAKAGVLLSGEGLKPTSQGARVQISGGKRTVIDGPFTESKELIAGFIVLQARSKEEAVSWVERWLRIHVQLDPAGVGEIEVRPLFDLGDYPVDPAEKPDGWRAHEQKFRDRSGT